MSTPRHPNRLKEYSADKTFYPRELVELDGILYLIGDDGTAVKLNETNTTTIKNSDSTDIGVVDPVSGGTITIPNADTDKGTPGLTRLYSTVNGDSKIGTANQQALKAAFAGKANTTHNHNPLQIPNTSEGSATSVPISLRGMVMGESPNVTAFLPANGISIEYSTNAGSTWSDYGASNETKEGLFIQKRSAYIDLKAPDGTVSSNTWVRVTVTPVDRTASALFLVFGSDGISLGNNAKVAIQASTVGAKDTFTNITTSDKPMASTNYHNIVTFTTKMFGGTASSNNYAFRFIFKPGTCTNGKIKDIRLYGTQLYSCSNTIAENIMRNNAIYYYDKDGNVTFPGSITATSFSGNATSADKLSSSKKISITGGATGNANFDGSSDISIDVTLNGLHKVATSGSYDDLTNKPTYDIPAPATEKPSSAGTTANVGLSVKYAREDHVHPAQTTITGKAGSATKLATARNINIIGAVTTDTAASFDGSKDVSINVTSLDGTKITGIIPLSSIPKGAQERLVPVANDTARLALTSEEVQNGDVVKVQDTGIMYYIVDDTKLGTTSKEDAFEVFTAGAASSVEWTGVNNKPDFKTVATSGKYSDLVEKAPDASSTEAGVAKLYDSVTDTNTDGSVTQSAIKTALDNKAASIHNHDTGTPTTSGFTKLYNTVAADNTDGTVTQKAIRAALATKASSSHTHDAATSTKSGFVKLYDTIGNDAETAATDGTVTQKAIVTALAAKSNSDHTHSAGTASALGFTKLYTGTGTNTDGTMTQAAINTALNGKAASSHSHNTGSTTASGFTKLYAETGSNTDGTMTQKAIKTALDGKVNTTDQATAAKLGLVKLYTSTGTATDGTMTQAAINTALNSKASSTHSHSTGSTTASGFTKLYAGTGTNTDGTMTQAAITSAIPVASTTAPKSNNGFEGNRGTSTKYAREDHKHPFLEEYTTGGIDDLFENGVYNLSKEFIYGYNINGTFPDYVTNAGASMATLIVFYNYDSVTQILITTAEKYENDEVVGKDERVYIRYYYESSTVSGGNTGWSNWYEVYTSANDNTGTATKSGFTKLYTSIGTNTDGTMTQKAITDAIPKTYTTVSHNTEYGSVGKLTNYARADHNHGFYDEITQDNIDYIITGGRYIVGGETLECESASIPVGAEWTDNDGYLQEAVLEVYHHYTSIIQVLIFSGEYSETNKVERMYMRCKYFASGSTNEQIHAIAWGAWNQIYTSNAPQPHETITTTKTTGSMYQLHPGNLFNVLINDDITTDNGHITKLNQRRYILPTASDHGFCYCTCDTESSSSTKVASPKYNGYRLHVSGIVAIKFTYAVTGDSTLNIASAGAKNMYNNGAAMTAGVINAGDTAVFMYDGTYYQLISVSSASRTYTANVSTTWTGSAAPYTQTITIAGMTANDNPIVDIVPSTTYATAKTQIADFGKIYKITTAANSITVYATEKTSATVPIQLKCVR